HTSVDLIGSCLMAPATAQLSTVSLHDALPISGVGSALHHAAQVVDRIQVHVGQAADLGFDVARHGQVDHDHGLVAARARSPFDQDRKSTRLNSSHVKISYAVFCLKKKNADQDN